MTLNVYYVCILLVDSICMSIWKIVNFLILYTFPMVLPPVYHEIDIEFLEIRGSPMPIISDTIYEEIDNFDYTFQSREPIVNAYYIGSYLYLPRRIVLGSVVSRDAFFRYTHEELYHYLVGYHISPSPEQAVHIVQFTGRTDIDYADITLGQVYFYNLTIVVKTYWIRIVQRTWARVYREKMCVVQIRKSLKAIRAFEVTGQYPEGARYMPSIYGMLSTHLSNVIK
jgi:hypothetical protein